MKYIITTLLLTLLFLPGFSEAEDIIKVLMLESPYEHLPSETTQTIDSLNGKVFINGYFYKGKLKIIKDEKGLYVINYLPFEQYVEGVVAAEASDDWEMEALKAQAVISRTFANFYQSLNTEKDFHLSSSVIHQLYKGYNNNPVIETAVKETLGEILTYKDSPIKAFYHANSEGNTELPEEIWAESYPYLKSVNCNSRNAPYKNWKRTFSINEISQKLGINNLDNISVLSYTVTGRVKALEIHSDNNKMEIKATDLRKLLGYEKLPSTQFSLSKGDKNIIFDGKGYGHGVGLCQWGAVEMAKQGLDYREILSYYYPGTTLQNNKKLHFQNLLSQKSTQHQNN